MLLEEAFKTFLMDWRIGDQGGGGSTENVSKPTASLQLKKTFFVVTNVD